MQPCSRRSLCLCTCLWVLALASQQLPQAAAARELRLSGHLEVSVYKVSRAAVEADVRESRIPDPSAGTKQRAGMAPVCSGAYVDVQLSDLSGFSSWGSFAPARIAGVEEPSGQHVVVAITDIRQNEAAQSHGQEGSCGDAQVNGLNSFFLRYVANEDSNDSSFSPGRSYYVSFTARNEAGLACEGRAELCIPRNGYAYCHTVPTEDFYDSRSCVHS